jgi:hypothetical protein
VAWYARTWGGQPDYSKLIEALARSEADRAALLRRYFEPTETDRDLGVKTPTRAHRAIAKLIAEGFIRVVLTTNFDRLLEHALEERGVAPVVVSTPAQIAGVLPLAHVRGLVIKTRDVP